MPKPSLVFHPGIPGVFHLHDRRHLESDRKFNLQPYWRNQQDNKFRNSKTFRIGHKGCKKNISHLHVTLISALYIDDKGFPGFRCTRLPFVIFAVNNPAAVKRSHIHSFQTQFLIIIKWPNLAQETNAILPFQMWSSYSMSCLKQPTTNCTIEIRKTSWAAALFAVVVSSLMTSQRCISCSILEQLGDGGILPPEWVVCL